MIGEDLDKGNCATLPLRPRGVGVACWLCVVCCVLCGGVGFGVCRCAVCVCGLCVWGVGLFQVGCVMWGQPPTANGTILC